MITATNHAPAQGIWSRSTFGRRSAPVLVAALAAFGLAAGTSPAAAQTSGPPCLWAGINYPQDSTVYAGGWEFTCQTELFGAPRWARGAQTARRSTVHSPGATGNPTGLYSPGARQPGTEYNDYCVGSQLIDGTEDIYEVVPANGYLYWRTAGSVSQWAFDDMATRHGPTTQSSSMCYNG